MSVHVCVLCDAKYVYICVHIPPTPSLQEQYIFIHDAVLESVTCGETQIAAGNLRHALAKLQMGPKAGPNGLVSQFQVSNVYFREFKIMRIG